jgi:hypothetical protein
MAPPPRPNASVPAAADPDPDDRTGSGPRTWPSRAPGYAHRAQGLADLALALDPKVQLCTRPRPRPGAGAGAGAAAILAYLDGLAASHWRGLRLLLTPDATEPWNLGQGPRPNWAEDRGSRHPSPAQAAGALQRTPLPCTGALPADSCRAPAHSGLQRCAALPPRAASSRWTPSRPALPARPQPRPEACSRSPTRLP